MTDYVAWLTAVVIVAAIIAAGAYAIYLIVQFIVWFWRYKP